MDNRCRRLDTVSNKLKHVPLVWNLDCRARMLDNRRHMDSRIWALFLPVAGVLSAADVSQVKVIEQIVAKVNGDIITRGELEKSRQVIELEMKQQNVPPEKRGELLKEREADGLRDQIDSLLLVQKGKQLDINVDADVTKELADIQLQNRINDPDKFHQWVQG